MGECAFERIRNSGAVRDKMKTIRIAFVGFWTGFDKMDNFIINALKERYYVQVIDPTDEVQKKSIEYLFYSDFSDEYLEYDCIRIFYTGENICPNMNECDYAIGFDYMEIEDRYIRYPLYLAMYERDVLDMLKKNENEKDSLAKRKFCAIVVSNSQCADPARRIFFEKLSNYQKVDSGGRYLNNINCPEGVQDKILFQKQYKFSIAFENSSHPGYCTEKLVQSFASQTIPIYWGDTRVSENFSSDAFINCHDYKTWDEVVEVVKKIDQDDELYLSILNNRAVDKLQLDTQTANFKKWIWHIIDQEYEKAFRRNLYGRCIAKEREQRQLRDNLKNLKQPLLMPVIKKIYHSISRHAKFDKVSNQSILPEVEMRLGEKNPDDIFYVIRRDGSKLGLLSFFNTNLGHISYAIKNGYIPIVDMQNYENIYLEKNEVGQKNTWDFYFNQPYGDKYSLSEVYESQHVIFSKTTPIEPRPDDDLDFLLNEYAYQYWHNLYCNYAKINDVIANEVDEFYQQKFNPITEKKESILGVYLRGTDYYSLRPNGHPIQPNIDEAIIEVKEAMDKWKCSFIYLVTEDKDIMEAMQKYFPNKIIRYNSQIYEYSGGFISDAKGKNRKNDRYMHGKEYLISTMLLTKCDCFIGGRTSGTVAMHIMGEGFEHEKFFDYGRYGTAEYEK